MYVVKGLLVLFIAAHAVSASVIDKEYAFEPFRNFEPVGSDDIRENVALSDSKVPEDRATITVTVTAKIWHVSDFHGKYTKPNLEKVDESCVDNPPEYCARNIVSEISRETIPEEIRNSWSEDTPNNRAQAVVDANLDYMNWALANSEIPIRYVQWGKVQDIGKTDKEIGSGYTGVGGVLPTRSSTDVFNSVKTIFGDSEEGRKRLYQTADVALLLLNFDMSDAAGVCTSFLHAPEGDQKEYRFAVFVASHSNGWLFSHEAGHCIGGMHLKPAGYTGSRTNWAYCPPEGEFGTIESYMWDCPKGPSGMSRGRVPNWSNPNVKVEGVPTGSETENNAGYMKEQRFKSAEAGTNCLDGNPDEAWMNQQSGGKIGNNCPNGESSYIPPLADSLVNCEYEAWGQWGECDKGCGGGSQTRKRKVKRQAWYGGVKCTEEDATEKKNCNEEACPECKNPDQFPAEVLSCVSSTSACGETCCKNTIDGDESTVWTSGLNGPDYQDDNTWKYGLKQWGYNTNVKVILSKEVVISGVQIINKVDAADFYENYREVKLAFSNGYEELVELSQAGKQNPIINLKQPVKSSFVNVKGVSTWGHMPGEPDSWLGVTHTGFRSGLSEIRVFGCSDGEWPKDGGWSEWGEWTACSGSCGQGTKSSSRTCTAPAPSGGGKDCAGENTKTKSCALVPCSGDICFPVLMRTMQYGKETSWSLGTCSNESPHVDFKTAAAECCLAPGEYTLNCKDSYGDGWGGGYIKVSGKKYCETFKEGKSETHEIVVGPDTVPDEDDEEWVEGKSCGNDYIEWLFCTNGNWDDVSLTEACLDACNTKDTCKFATLFNNAPERQCCWSYGAGCAPMVRDKPEKYKLYIKP